MAAVYWLGVQQNASSTTSPTVGQDTTGNNFLVACVTNSDTAAGQSIADTIGGVASGNTWQTVTTPFSSSTDAITIFYAMNANVGANHVITLTKGSGAFTTLCCGAYPGLLTASALDVFKTGSGSGTALASGNTTTTSQADELLIVTGTVSSGSNSSFTGTGGFTVRSSVGNASIGTVGFLADQTVAAAAAYSGTATWNGTGGAWVAEIATFKLSASSGPVLLPSFAARKNVLLRL